MSLATGRLVTAAMVIALCGVAHADFTYDDFTDTSGLQLNGDTASVGGALRLSTASFDSAGSVFTASPVDLGEANSFSTYFRFRISSIPETFGDDDGPGADGLAFVVQTQANNVGGAGSGIGYEGISPSLGVEFDTYDNGAPGDPNGNHVGVDLDGSTSSVASAIEPVRFNEGFVWNVWIDYDGTSGLLETRWSTDATRPAAAQLSASVDLETILGEPQGFIGFTSATGSGFGDHDILYWTFRGEFNPVVPEPSTAALLLAVGLLARGCRCPTPRRS